MAESQTITETLYVHLPAELPTRLAPVAHRRYDTLENAIDGLKIVAGQGEWRIVRVDSTHVVTPVEDADGD